ncbi:AAA family ATPase [Streptomyces sp. NPDC051940]|uniref:helix-turn-helix transcriptional regulator n=1 Tax=Streptomyces sp. NPDC051940 TaxID=3155675 RepID=UPI003435B6E3
MRAAVLSPVFAGRTEELNTLTTALARAAAGEPQAFVVGGEAGVGKSRLLEEFLRSAREQGAVTAVGPCLELGADGLPFAPLVTALRVLQRELGSDALAAAAAGREAELARLLPDLAPAAARTDSESRTRLYELTARLLERLAADRTIVLALEDLHWSDGSTRELLGYLFRTLQDTRLVVIATYRSDDVHRRHPLRPFLAETDRLRSVRRIDLPPLTEEEVAEQLAGIRGEADPDLARRVFERSEGNPFFVEELACGDRGTMLSDSLRDLLLVRVERLPEQAQRVVRIAAEGESRIEYGLLAAVCGLPEEELLAALREAVTGRVLTAGDGDSYRFRHSLLREAVCDDHLPGECARLHRRYAETLAARPELVDREQYLTRLAWHWYYGREPLRALPVVLAASAEARGRHAFAEQYALLHRALELWDEVPAEVRAGLRPFDGAENYPPESAAAAPGVPAAGAALSGLDLLAEAVVAARYAGEFDRALSVAKRALRQLDEDHPGALDSAGDPGGASTTGDPGGVRTRAAWFWLQRARLAEDLGRGDGRAELVAAERLLTGLDASTVQAEVLTHLACWLTAHDPGPDALRVAEQAVRLAGRTGPESVEIGARVTRAVLRCDLGDTETGLAELTEARDRAHAAGFHSAAVRAEINLSAELEALGRSAEAARIATAAARAAEAQGRRDYQVFCLANQIEALIPLGRWDEAAEVAEYAGRIRTAAVTSRASIAHSMAQLALRRGALDSARVQADRAVAELGPLAGKRFAALSLGALLTELNTARGDFAAAREEALRAMAVGRTPGIHVLAWPLLHLAAANESAESGPPADRGEFLARVREAAARLPRHAPVWAAYALLVEAEADRAEGERDPGRWRKVAAAFEPLDRPYQLAIARLREADALLAARRTSVPPGETRARAGDLLRQAHATAVRLRAAGLRAETEHLAARAGVPLTEGDTPPPADPLARFRLTPRERDVFRLVAAGRTNRHIAEALFISPKTASVHVSNLMAKLAVSSRGEAAALAHRLRVFDAPDPAPDIHGRPVPTGADTASTAGP